MRGPKTTDRRVQRTRRALRDALIALILERGWDKVSIQDVCDRADVGRSTFYTHFVDKEELLGSGFDELRRMLRSSPTNTAGDITRPLGFARGMIEHAYEQRRLFRAIVGKRSGRVVQKRFTRLVIDLVKEDISGLIPAGPRREAAARYISGAFLELLIWWIDTRNPLQPAEVDALFRRLSAPALDALRGLA